MKLLYPEECTWELDYIKEITGFNCNSDLETYNINNCKLLLEREDIVSNCLFVMSVLFYDINNMEEIVKKIQPLVIFSLSDERGIFQKYNDLEKYTKLFLRQYNHKSYNYSSHNIQIPLGYVSNFLPSNNNNIVTMLVADPLLRSRLCTSTSTQARR
jgi:hypothetical protein